MRFDSKNHYPEYYKNVFIEYCPSDSDRYLIAEGWISVDDNGITSVNDKSIKKY